MKKYRLKIIVIIFPLLLVVSTLYFIVIDKDYSFVALFSITFFSCILALFLSYSVKITNERIIISRLIMPDQLKWEDINGLVLNSNFFSNRLYYYSCKYNQNRFIALGFMSKKFTNEILKKLQEGKMPNCTYKQL